MNGKATVCCVAAPTGECKAGRHNKAGAQVTQFLPHLHIELVHNNNNNTMLLKLESCCSTANCHFKHAVPAADVMLRRNTTNTLN
jgi:hypothetical protein